MLSIEHLTKYYGEKVGVKDLSIKVKKGRVLGILGSNGSGKTTTFRVLLGLLEKSDGSIKYDGKELDFTDKCLFGYLPEEKSMLRDLKVKDQVFHLARLKKLDDDLIQERLDYWLKYLNIERFRELKQKNGDLIRNRCVPVIGKYMNKYKYNSKNIARYLQEKKEFNLLPYNLFKRERV